MSTYRVLSEVLQERRRQDDRWGQQDHECRLFYAFDMGAAAAIADAWKAENAERVEVDQLCWDGILLEEVYEAMAENDPAKRRAELLQVAAVAVAQVEAIDRRAARS